MRIIAGEFRSRKLFAPPDAETTRPIPDRVKESIFALLRGHTEGASVFDGFSGSGAFGLEAVSRGATRCVMVEKDRSAADLIRANIETLGAGDRAELVHGDALGPGALARCPRPASIVFLDPPYPLARDPIGWKRITSQFERLVSCLSDDGFALIRTPWPFVHLVMPDGTTAPQEEEADEPRGRSSRRAGTEVPGVAGAGGARGKGRRSKRIRTGKIPDHEIEIWSIERDAGRPVKGIDDEIDESDAAAELAAAAVDPNAPKPERVFPSLVIPGAVGPETHEYGSMAVHFYMKARSPASA
jgi:16S rRNA (guanine966-N2)-methyltransferase